MKQYKWLKEEGVESNKREILVTEEVTEVKEDTISLNVLKERLKAAKKYVKDLEKEIKDIKTTLKID